MLSIRTALVLIEIIISTFHFYSIIWVVNGDMNKNRYTADSSEYF